MVNKKMFIAFLVKQKHKHLNIKQDKREGVISRHTIRDSFENEVNRMEYMETYTKADLYEFKDFLRVTFEKDVTRSRREKSRKL
jgi:hypothetical protein